MVEDHPEFRAPDPKVPLWRYLDFTKFVYMLESRALFMACATHFVDRFEGSFTLRDAKDRLDWSRGLAPESLRRSTAISCWHLNEYESAAMWELYLKSDEGVAIRSSGPRLRQALEGAAETVHVGRVGYVDYDREKIPKRSTFSPFLHKRRSFAHEREVRAVLQRLPGPDGAPALPEDGLALPVDLDVLVERIYVAPNAPDWFHRLVEAVSKRYGLEKDIVRSELGRDPIY